MLQVMVSLDLEDAEGVRYEFNALLESSNWVKLKNVDTVWSFNYPDRDQSHYQTTKTYVADKLMKAAKEFRIKGITAVAQIGNSKAFGHQITLKSGVHVGRDFDPYQ
ncbi:hypothetical protein cym2001_52600 [Pseudomonas sp. CYM-20-01]|uniref:hypothetical protein n=1 Tax=Pseudomonas sp. CYM-20-01 TaxID=2870750 RepID=UPI002067F3A2|nr:hypothetical protein [Pseudomonas sp. CYM-20-01]BDB21895.1 hypothetical protein cym2001_52600 [Pseudomonas sp. CYM-20-01]